jgi:hypothetical protein
MNSKTFFSKTTSVVASIVLALGGSLVATQPASAVAPSFTMGSSSGSGPTAANFSVTNLTNTNELYWVLDLASSAGPDDANAVINHTGYSSPFFGMITSSSFIGPSSNIASIPLTGLSASTTNYVIYVVAKNTGTQEFAMQNSAFTFPSAPPPPPSNNVVTLNANGGVLGTTTTITQNGGGAPVALPTSGGTAPTKANCSLSGWATTQANANAGTLIANPGAYVPALSITVYASWACSSPSVTYTNTAAASFTMSNGVATYTAGTWTASDSSTPTISFLWLFCDSGHNADSGSSGGPAADCGPIAATDISGNSANGAAWIRTSTLSIPATAFKWVSSANAIVTVASAALNTKHIAVYESVSGNWKVSATVAVTETAQQVTAVVERSIPVPVFQAPILNSLAPKLTSGFSSNGGRLVMKDVKPADIASVMLNGKKVEVVASKSGAALRIPAGSGAGDLTFTMADGSVITVANAVKITQSAVDPKAVPLNSLPKFTGSSVAVPKAVKTAITKTKKIILESESAKCVGYASSNTAASKAVALARATNVCGVISDINENIEPIVKVLVNKTIAKKSPVRYLTW